MQNLSQGALRHLMLSTVSIAALGGSPALAQSASADASAQVTLAPAPDPADACAPAAGKELPDSCDAAGTITVTGSRIRRPNLDSPVPVATVTQEQLFETGRVAVGEVLNELPQLRSTFNQQNTPNTLGLSGLNLLDLRGLGTQRTLVLVNGRRHVGSDIYNNAASPDVNTIPTALIDRVDVVTGGNSAIYGSDAIAGVVNFILKRDFTGIDVRAQTGISEFEDANTYFASLTAGHNFGDDRGNVAFSGEYSRQEQYFGDVRPYIRSQDLFLVVDTDPAGTPNGSDGNPDRIFFRDIRSATLSNTGTIIFGFNAPNATFNCGRDPIGGFYACPYIWQPDGTPRAPDRNACRDRPERQFPRRQRGWVPHG